MRRWAVLLVVVGAGCDEPAEPPPNLIAHPETRPLATTPTKAPDDYEVGPPAPAPPWPEMVVSPGRYSPEFAADYVAQVKAEREAFDAEMAKPRDPARDNNEAKHRVISEKGRRARLMNKPQLADMTDAQVSDVLSFSPDMPSAPREFGRLLGEYPSDVHVCVDHARWLQFRREKEAAIAEYTRCGTLAEASEEIRRYIHTQIAAVKALK